jgi:hypothetical protein
MRLPYELRTQRGKKKSHIANRVGVAEVVVVAVAVADQRAVLLKMPVGYQFAHHERTKNAEVPIRILHK